MGLFKPKWKHSYRNVRLPAVRKLDDQDLLLEIAKNDKDKWLAQQHTAGVLPLKYFKSRLEKINLM